MKRIFGIAVVFAILFGSVSAHSGELLDSGRIIAAMEDNYGGYYYRNIHSQESFIALLEDDYSAERYAAVMDAGRFAPLLAEKHAEEAATASYAPRCGHRDIDYLSTKIILAKLTEACMP